MNEPQQYRRSAEALFSEVGDDVIALHIARGHCYGMANVSATIWHLLAEPMDLESICTHLLDLYDVEVDRCRSDVAAVLEQFRKEGLVEAVER